MYQSINEKILNTNLLQKEDLNLFNELKDKYPYSEIFNLTYLKLVNKFDSLNLEENLVNTAYKIRDRKKIVELLNDTANFLEEEIPSETNDLSSVELIVSEETKLENETLAQSTVEDEQIENDELKTSLDTQINAEALTTIFSLDFEPTIQYQIEDNSIVKESEAIEKKENNIQSHKKFTDWLKSNKSEEKTDKDQLINNIIATNPSISRTKKEFYNPSKQAIKSVDDEQLIYTETLAKILEMQGNFTKAISAYNQLSLTIPEKKTYFAKKIKELNEKLNTK